MMPIPPHFMTPLTGHLMPCLPSHATLTSLGLRFMLHTLAAAFAEPMPSLPSPGQGPGHDAGSICCSQLQSANFDLLDGFDTVDGRRHRVHQPEAVQDTSIASRWVSARDFVNNPHQAACGLSGSANMESCLRRKPPCCKLTMAIFFDR